jgi:hypothetical protein
LAHANPLSYLQFLRAGEASKLFVTGRPFLFTVSGSQATYLFTVSGSHLGTAATVWRVLRWYILIPFDLLPCWKVRRN